MTKDEILNALGKLSHEDLATVKAAADHLLSSRPTHSDDPTAQLYDILAGLLGLRMSFRDFHQVSAYKLWRKNAPHAITFIATTFPQANRVARLAIMRFLVEALIADLRERGLYITMTNISANLDRLPIIFDQAFPDYRQTDMAHLVLEAMVKKGSK